MCTRATFWTCNEANWGIKALFHSCRFPSHFHVWPRLSFPFESSGRAVGNPPLAIRRWKVAGDNAP